ncbi:MAG TPA: HNH endonuclease [Nitrososphaera sp.]|nr:HNH endonuclease [Nitrososphaera sp.]
MGFSFSDDEAVRRTFSKLDRQRLLERAGRKCENCGVPLDSGDMEVGHKTAWSRGGTTTFRNSWCLCHSCNRKQGTDSKSTFQRKLGKESPSAKTKNGLNSLSMGQLRYLAKKHGVNVKGRIADDWGFDTYRKSPNKKQYINAPSRVVSSREIAAAKTAKPVAKRRRKRSSSWSFW